MTIYFSLDLIKSLNHIFFYFNRFEEEAGIIPLNSSSFFHFFTLKLESEEFVNGGFDFKSFRVKSLETYFNEYYENRNLNNYDHWISGYCKNEIDIV